MNWLSRSILIALVLSGTSVAQVVEELPTLTLTQTCLDDKLLWTPVDYSTRVTWNGTFQEALPQESGLLIGCFDGTVRVAHYEETEEGEARFVHWEADPGRLMKWSEPCPVSSEGAGYCPTGRLP